MLTRKKLIEGEFRKRLHVANAEGCEMARFALTTAPQFFYTAQIGRVYSSGRTRTKPGSPNKGER
jgi:hypothetical protein